MTRFGYTLMTDVAVVQVGDENQQRFLDDIAQPLLDRLRRL